MAVAFVANRASVQSASVLTNMLLPLTTGASISVGSTLLLYAAFDEGTSAQAGGAAITAVTNYISDNPTFWQRVARVNNDVSGTDAGVVIEVWAAYVQRSYTNVSNIYVSFNESISRGVFLIKEFSGVAPNFANSSGGNLVGPVYGNSVVSNTATGNGTTIGSLTVQPPAAGWLVVGAAGIETNTAITGDADTTDGSWSAVGTTVSNSGTDATSVTLSEQYKIVTGTSTQNWAVTKTGAADWATVLVGLPFYTSVTPTRPAGNPNYPCIAGYEGLPTEEITVPLDTGTGYVYTTTSIYSNAQNTDSLTAATALKNVKDGLSQHTLAWDLAYSTTALANDEPITVSVPVAACTSTGSVSAPAVTPLDAITEIGEGYLRLDAGEVLNFRIDGSTFATTYSGYRILNFGIRYIAWRNDTPYGESSAPSVGMKVTWKDVRNAPSGTATAYDHGYWLVPNYRSTMGFETRMLGETNYIPTYTNTGPYTGRSARNFTMRDMADQNVGTGTSITIECVVGSDTTQNVIFIDYLELVFTLVPERRLANANTLVSNIPYVYDSVQAIKNGVPPFGFDQNITGAFFDVGAAALQLDYYNFVLPTINGASPLMFTVREALPADGSDFFRALVVDPDDPGNVESKYTAAEAIGTPLQLQALTSLRATLDRYPTIFLGTFVDGLGVDADNFPIIENYIPAASVYPRAIAVTDGYLWPQFNTLGYPTQVAVQQNLTAITQTQYVQVPGGQSYTHVKLLMKADPTTPGTTTLTVSVQQPLATPLATATITRAQLNLLDDVGGGWKEATLLLSAPITPAAGQVALVFSSSATSGFIPSFYLQGSYPKTLSSGYNNAAPNDDTRPTDTSAVLMCAIPTPNVSLGSTTLTMLPLFPNFTGCLTGSYQHPRITISNSNVYDYLTVERSSDGGNTWQLVQLIESAGLLIDMRDQEVPWDIQILYPITYRVRGYRDADRNFAETITSSWTGTSTSPGQVIGLASNDSGYEFWFTPVTEGSLEIQWTPLSPVNFVDLHGKDYAYAQREAEDRGFEMTVPIVVNQTAFCATTGSSYISNVTPYGEALGKGARSFSPRIYEAFVMPIIRSSARWTLKLPGGHTRNVTVQAGDFTTITQNGLYLTELKIRDVVAPDPDPYCEGLA